LESVLAQIYSNLEVLVVDDGSTVDIEGVVRKPGDGRLSYHRLPHTNANVARNYGITLATGKYIAMLDADDLWLPNHVDECIRKIKETGADAVYGSLVVRNLASDNEHPVIVHGPWDGETMINYLLRTGFGAQTSTLFMTAASAKNILWDETLLRHQDYDFVVRYSKRYSMAVKSENPTVIYRQSPKASKIDLRSCIRVIEANAADVEPDVYVNYNLNMLRVALRQNDDDEIVDHYRKEATSLKECVSFKKFLEITSPQTTEQVETLRKEYCDYISALKVEF
jgi:glycosyltransferase involved in cell wall biosynthesis